MLLFKPSTFFSILTVMLVFSCQKDIVDIDPVSEAGKGVWLARTSIVRENCRVDVSTRLTHQSGPKSSLKRYGHVYTFENRVPDMTDNIYENANDPLVQFAVNFWFSNNFENFSDTLRARAFAEIDDSLQYISDVQVVTFELEDFISDVSILDVICDNGKIQGNFTTCNQGVGDEEYGLIFAKFQGEAIDSYGPHYPIGNLGKGQVHQIDMQFPEIDKDFNVCAVYIKKKNSEDLLISSAYSSIKRPLENISITRLNNFDSVDVYDPTGFVINNSGFLIGGRYINSTDDDLFSRSLWKYSLGDDTWERMADFPGHPRGKLTSFTIGNFAYVGAGADTSNTVFDDFYRYDLESDTWLRIADFPFSGHSGVSFSVNGRGYVVGMKSTETEQRHEFYSYDPILDTWKFVDEISKSYEDKPFNVTVLKGKPYIAISFENSVRLLDFDPVNEKWSNFSTSIQDLYDFEYMYAQNDKIYFYHALPNLKIVEFDPVTNLKIEYCPEDLRQGPGDVGLYLENSLYLVYGTTHSTGPYAAAVHQITIE